jgi:hypothetical protein
MRVPGRTEGATIISAIGVGSSQQITTAVRPAR